MAGGSNKTSHKIIIGGIILLFLLSSVSPMTLGLDATPLVISNETVDGPMDSAWPMFGHDVRHTGRSPYGKDGNLLILKWKFFIDSLIFSSSAIDNDGIIYVGGGVFDKCLFAFYPDGTEKWRFETNGHIQSSPAIAEDGTIYVGSNDAGLYAIYPNGTEKWRLGLGSGWVYSSPVIDEDGMIYAASVGSSRLVAVYPNGTIKWDFYADDWIYSSPTIGDDGTIYIGSNDNYMYALYSNGTLKWRFKAMDFIQDSAATLTDDGTIYFGSWDGHLYSLYKNGTLKWKFNSGDTIESSPAIGINGDIYFGSNNGYFYCLNSEGTEIWRYDTGDEIYSSPSIDKYGIIYFSSINGNFYALYPNGSLNWIYRTESGSPILSSPAIGEDGTVYFGSWDGYFYALEIIDNHPPDKPITPTGEVSGRISTQYKYSSSTIDIDGDYVSYFFHWDDGTNSSWLGPYLSNDTCSAFKTWSTVRDYSVKVKAKDEFGAESDWSDPLVVSMPKNIRYFNLFYWFLDRLDIQRWIE